MGQPIAYSWTFNNSDLIIELDGKKIFICYVNDILLSDIIMKIQSHNMDKHMTISKCEYQIIILWHLKFDYIILN